MSKEEALAFDLALEALGLYQAAGFGNSTDFNKQHEAFYKAQTAITAIKQARSAPTVQEPYARIYETEGPFGLHQSLECRSYNGRNPDRVVPVYTTPTAQREWVDLTDEEVFEIFGHFTAMAGKGWLYLYRMTEAKLKEKNT